MRKKGFYLWSLLVVLLTATSCSSDHNEDDLPAKTGTFELNFTFEGTSEKTRASTAIPETNWKNINQIQFFLHDSKNKVVFSSIVAPTSGNTGSKTYTYTAIPVGEYTLVAVANAKSDKDNVTTYISSAPQTWTEGNVYNMEIKDLFIKHKPGSWSTAITGNANAKAVVDKLFPHTEPSEIFMGYATGIKINTAAPHKASVSLKREVSMMRVRIDQKTHKEAKEVDFGAATASVILYRLPDQMGIGNGNLGGISTTSTEANAVSVSGAFSSANNNAYLDGNFSLWKDVIVFPNNGGRANNSATTATADDYRKYFVVLCGIAKSGHYYSGGKQAAAGDPVFWYGQIKEVFTPNTIREVNLILKTGGLPTPPDKVIDFGGLEVSVSEPEKWSSNIVVSTIEM